MPTRTPLRPPVKPRRTRLRWGRVLLVLLLLALLVCGAVFLLHLLQAPAPSEATQPAPTAPTAPPPTLPESYSYSVYPLPPEDLAAQSQSVLLFRLRDGAVYLDYGASERIYPASMSKMMTAITAIDTLQGDYSGSFTFDEALFATLKEAGASTAGFKPFETVSATDLLYGVMLPSGADACIGLATMIAGSEEAFVALMNEKAAELGMQGSHFQNTTGLHHEQHYTTCEDLAILMQYALENELFYEIITARSYSRPASDFHPDGHHFSSSLFAALNRSEAELSFTVLGGKTGYTRQAGQCLASFAEKGGTQYMLITAGAPGDYTGDPLHILDAIELYERCLP